MEVKFAASQADFFKKLRSEVNDYFHQKNIKSTGGISLWIKAIALILSLSGIYFWLVAFQPYSWWICIPLYIVLGIVIALIGFNLMHDGAHGSFSRHKYINVIMAHSLNLLGGNSLLWSKKHNINHHTYTNIQSADDDINLEPFIRLHDHQKKRWFHRYQHIYAIFLYGITYIMWIYFLDFKKYFSGRIGDDTPIPVMKFKEHLIFWLSKVFHIFIFVVFPVIMLGPAKALIGYLIAATVTGFIIATVFQLAHIVEGTHFESPSESSDIIDIKSEWAIHQLNTTVDFATNNKFLTWCVGGLNFQMVHHLFPKISHVHYPAIRPIIISACKQHNLQYIEFPSLTAAIKSHLKHLKTTGRVA